MPRYAMMDLNSGFVWGVEDAETPAEACRLLDESVGAVGLIYEERGPRSGVDRNGGSGYAVYLCPPGFDVGNGQDPDAIAAVERLERVAIVLMSWGDEDEWAAADEDAEVRA